MYCITCIVRYNIHQMISMLNLRNHLQDVGALGQSPAVASALPADEGGLTPLGRHLAALPVEPRLGKLLVLGACLACLGPACTIAAAMSHKSPFSAAMERKAEAALARKALAAPGRYGRKERGCQPPGQS